MPCVIKRFRVRFGVSPQLLVAQSAAWDASRACQLQGTRAYAPADGHTFVAEWERNATRFVSHLRQHVTHIVWRTPNTLPPPPSSTRACAEANGVKRPWVEHVCHAGAPMYACRDVHHYHNLLGNATARLMARLRVPLLRWGAFVDAAGDAARAIHPPLSIHAAFANLMLNVLRPSE